MENPRSMSTTASGHSEDSELPSETVVSSVAAYKGVDAGALPPLYDALDPDALDALFSTPGGSPGRVTFDYAGCTVECASDGSVDVRDGAA